MIKKTDISARKELTAIELSHLIAEQIAEANLITTEFKSQYQSLFAHISELSAAYNFSSDLKKGLELFIHRVLVAQVVNGVCPINVGMAISKEKVIAACVKHNLEHRICQKFSGLPVKFDKDGVKFTATFFKSGKINVVGLSNDKPEYLNKVIQIIKEHQIDFFGVPLMDNSTKRLANRVYAIKIPKLIDLSNLEIFNSLSTWKNIKYNSQTFPGVRLKFENFKSKALVFKTGSMILTGIISFDCKKKLLVELSSCLAEYLSYSANINSGTI